jgi:hypothetical protein
MKINDMLQSGNLLSACRSGWFGAECRETCSTTCKNSACTHTNGSCIGGCKAGYQGNMCERRKSLKLLCYIISQFLLIKYHEFLTSSKNIPALLSSYRFIYA